MIADYFMSLDPLALLRAMPGTAAQGIIWGIMALGVYITFRILDFADLSGAHNAAVSIRITAGVIPSDDLMAAVHLKSHLRPPGKSLCLPSLPGTVNIQTQTSG